MAVGVSLPEAVGEGCVLLYVHRQIQEVLIFTAHSLTAQALGLIGQSALEDLLHPCLLSRLASLTQLGWIHRGVYLQAISSSNLLSSRSLLLPAPPSPTHPTCHIVSNGVEEVDEQLVRVLLVHVVKQFCRLGGELCGGSRYQHGIPTAHYRCPFSLWSQTFAD